ncbi:Uncharacterised protein (plasmid) [Legionella adelaidensis]|uniref:Uncharacterized protein n=2 Tax=Legionella adelaidensis TaxID=45056 RepID=A0A0W0R1S8_9GAMM|nr:hypothetical protein [Legionella adelaidensis]KTC64986.1 hypothetical protein Lade_1666 [Legionella adelaidensis]VEH85334.1 Uncharacterised protein [Legionella adelaidensis]
MIATKNLYKVMCLDEYNTAMEKHLKSLAFNYNGKTIEEKWALLIDKFKGFVPQYSAQFDLFKERREGVTDVAYNLNLSTTVKYFENFVFLYEVSEPRFKLTPFQKTQMIEDIIQAMNMCETGVETRFIECLNKFRTDLNWITNLLAKYRYDLFVKIQDKYNALNNISEELRTHVLKRMCHRGGVKYGVAYGGASIRAISDIFAHLVNGSHIDAFFDSEADEVFALDYEEQIVDILSHELMLKINASLKHQQEVYGLTPLDWKKNRIEIKCGDVPEFGKYLDSFLQLPHYDARELLSKLGTLDEGYTDTQGEWVYGTGNFTIYKKKQVFPVLKALIREKLLREEYFLTLDSLTKDTVDLIHNPHLKVFAPQIIAFTQKIEKSRDNLEELKALLLANQWLLLNYPELIHECLLKYPLVLKLLPPAVKNPFFIDKLIPVFEELLHENNLENYKPEVGDAIIELLRKSPESLRLLKIGSHHLQFAFKLIRSIPDAYAMLLPNNNWIKEYQLSDIACINGPTDRNSAKEELLQNEELSLENTARLVQYLNFDDLIEIINTRKQTGLSPLPYFPSESGLRRFKAAVQTKYEVQDLIQSYSSLRKLISERMRFCTKQDKYGETPFKYIAENKSLYLAFLEYQANHHRLTSWEHFWSKIASIFMNMAKIMLKAATAILISSLGLSAAAIATHLIYSLLPAWGFSLLILGICAPVLTRPFTNNRWINSLSYVCASLSILCLLLDSIAFGLTFLYMGRTTVHIISLSFEIIKDAFSLLYRSINSLLFTPHTSEEVRSQCYESINRLEIMNDSSAKEKANILKCILRQVEDEIAQDIQGRPHYPNEVETAFNRKLSQKYDIEYRDATYHLSFYEAAELKRSKNKPLVINQEKVDQAGYNPHRWFKTTTEKILPSLDRLNTAPLLLNV